MRFIALSTLLFDAVAWPSSAPSGQKPCPFSQLHRRMQEQVSTETLMYVAITEPSTTTDHEGSLLVRLLADVPTYLPTY